MEADRVVPVSRLVNGNRRVGSGYRIGGRFILTAAHCVRGTGCRVWLPDGERDVQLVADGGPSGVDLAMLEIVPALGQAAVADMAPVRCARVDRSVPGRIDGCVAVGYPQHAARPEAPFTTSEVDGWIPAGSGLTSSADGQQTGYLTLRAEGTPPRPLPTKDSDLGRSPWAGMSGAAVFASGLLVGVVAEHHLPEGDGSLTVVPIEWADRLAHPERERLLNALGVASAEEIAQVVAGILASRTAAVQPDSRLDAGAVRRFVDDALSDEDVNDLSIDHFPTVYRDFSATAGRRSKIRQLVEYADRHDRLSELVRWARESNPAAYARHEQELRAD